MGGHAYVIPGRLAPERLAARQQVPEPARPAPFWRKLLGSTASGAEAPSVVQLPNGDRLLEIPAAPLDAALVGDLRAWIGQRIPQPSRGTSVVLEYLTDIEPSVRVRGVQRAGEDEAAHYVQVAFSGCAGEAETSARAASHWAAAWYASEHRRIASEHLTPFGFVPAIDAPGDDESMAFLPAGNLGYLEYVRAFARGAEQPAFEIDHAAAEANEGNPLLTRLDDVFAGFMRQASCRCQLCEPEFGDAAFDEDR